MSRHELGGISIDAPCPHCVRRWLPLDSFDLDVDLSLEPYAPRPGAEEAILRDSAGGEVRGEYLPHPECSRHVAARAPVDLQRSLRPGPLGPIKRLTFEQLAEDAPFVATAVIDRPRRAPRGLVLSGGGVDPAKEVASIKASVEAIERFCAYSTPRVPLHFGAAENFREVGEEDRGLGGNTWWCEARSPKDGATMLVPLDRIQVGRARGGSSTGMAAFPTVEGAIERGYLEVVERAGLRMLWNRPLSTFPAGAWSAAIERAGFRVEAAVVEPIAGYYCAAMFALRDRGPALIAASGAGTTRDAALAHAAAELYGQVVQALRVWSEGFTAPERPGSPIDHFFYYLRPENARGLWEAWKYHSHAGAEVVSTPNYFVVDRGNSLTDYLGLSVVHVIVPGLVPLAFGEPGPGGRPIPFA